MKIINTNIDDAVAISPSLSCSNPYFCVSTISFELNNDNNN